jgi:hypothetical protein
MRRAADENLAGSRALLGICTVDDDQKQAVVTVEQTFLGREGDRTHGRGVATAGMRSVGGTIGRPGIRTSGTMLFAPQFGSLQKFAQEAIG